MEPGSSISIPFTVATTTNGIIDNSATGTFKIRVSSDRSYASSSPTAIMAGSGGTANSTVNLTVPDSAASGTDVTLTIEVQNAAGTDMNYIVLRFTVVAKVTIVGCQTK